MSKQTAIEWLVEELNQKIDIIPMDKWDIIRDMVQQAKEMEQEQIERAWMNAEINLPSESRARAFARKYYNQTYGGEK